MPLTAKGQEILAALTKEYGAKKAKEVLYAGKNSGRFKGIDIGDMKEIEDGLEEEEAVGDDCHCHDEKPQRKPIHIIIKTK